MAGKGRIRGFVLAGGKSNRMGRDKALILFRKKPLLLRTAELLKPYVYKVTLIGPPERYGNLGLSVLADKWPEQGPLAAVGTGLLTSNAEWNIFLACDLPLASCQFMELLIKRIRATHCDAVVPCTHDIWQPLAAAYHIRCRDLISRAIKAGRRSMVGLLDEVRVDAITLREMISAGLNGTELTNMNSPEDLKRIRKLSKGDR